MAAHRDADAWATLGDRTRRAILERLAERPRAVGELADELPVSRPAVSQHLKVLKDAGLVAERAPGPAGSTGSTRPGSAALRDQLDTFWNRALAGYKTHRRTTEETMTADNRSRRPPRGRRRRPDRAGVLACSPSGSVTSSRRSTTCSASPIAETVFEPKSAATSTTAAMDGTECHWARVLAYEPPDRVVFSWDIGPTWQVETNPDRTSEVEVRFIAEAPTAPGSSSSTATSTGTAPAGKASATASTTRGMAAVPGAVRRSRTRRLRVDLVGGVPAAGGTRLAARIT